MRGCSRTSGLDVMFRDENECDIRFCWSNKACMSYTFIVKFPGVARDLDALCLPINPL